MKNKILIILFLFWGSSRCSLNISDVDLEDKLKNLELTPEEKVINDDFEEVFQLSKCSGFLGATITTCKRYSDTLFQETEGLELSIKQGFWRFMTLISTQNISKLKIKLEQKNIAEESKKIGNEILKWDTFLKTILKKYVTKIFPNLYGKKIINGFEETYGNDIYDLITKQLCGNQINKNIYKKWKSIWTSEHGHEEEHDSQYIIDILEITREQYLENSSAYRRKLKKHYKDHHQFDWIQYIDAQQLLEMYVPYEFNLLKNFKLSLLSIFFNKPSSN